MKEEFIKIKEDIKEIVNERFYSPMYFYFIIAWIIANWKFVYVLFFSNEGFLFGNLHLLKIDYLLSFYPVNNHFDILYNIAVLLLIPAFFSYLAVWWFTILSESFYKKYETHKQNKRVIQRELEYREKFRFAQAENKIKKLEQEQGKKDIEYEDNKEFNETLDASNEMVNVNGIMMNPSEVLYNNDYVAYRESLGSFRENLSIEKQEEKNKIDLDKKKKEIAERMWRNSSR